jgi:hypothetical protein
LLCGRSVDVAGLYRKTLIGPRFDVAERWRIIRWRRLAGFATVPLWFLRGLVR